MRFHPKVRNAALVGALAAVAATAWATHETIVIKDSAYVPAYTVAVEEPAAAPVVVGETLEANDTLSPNERVILVADEPAPVIERSTVAQPAITIEQRRLSNDERIQAQVMDRIAAMRNVSGKIGVESNDAVVRLTGYTSTSGQAYRAGREASSVMGVKYVQNEIRPRVGGSV